jgi:hypothetical protein
MSAVQKLRSELIRLIESNIKAFNSKSFTKFYKIAYTGQTNKIKKTIEFINDSYLVMIILIKLLLRVQKIILLKKLIIIWLNLIIHWMKEPI